jgi:hypothetical protein
MPLCPHGQAGSRFRYSPSNPRLICEWSHPERSELSIKFLITERDHFGLKHAAQSLMQLVIKILQLSLISQPKCTLRFWSVFGIWYLVFGIWYLFK